MKALAFMLVLSMVLLSTTALADESANKAVKIEGVDLSTVGDPLSTENKTGVSGLISYQGALTKSSGVALDTTVDMTFTIYTTESGAFIKWAETQLDVPVIAGLFNVFLGSVNAIPDTVFRESERWLGIQVGSDPELDPRQRIASVGYAFRAAEADSADYARDVAAVGGWVDDGTVVRLATHSDSVGIGTLNPDAKLDIRGGLNVGVDGDGYSVNFYGEASGSRMYWAKQRGALRAGRDSDGNHWAPDSIGGSSLATGRNTKAKGDYSTAMGEGTVASGSAATAMGDSTIASGYSSTAMGYETTASGYASTAMGYGTTASGYVSTAMGRDATATGQYATAIGRMVKAGPADYAMVLGRGATGDTLKNNVENSLMVGFNTTTPTLFVGGNHNRVGIGTSDPQQNLHVVGTDSSVTLLISPAFGPQGESAIILAEGPEINYTMRIRYDGDDNKLKIYGKAEGIVYGPHLVINRNDGKVGIGTDSPSTKLDVAGTTTTEILTITGGKDLAEPFALSDDKNIPAGALVVIDDQNPGKLRMSDRPYDRRAAGVVSGAGGINPGITLGKLGEIKDGRDVALSGRVYALADASNGAIVPGDLLTTSSAPGHAMKVTDHARAQGAIIGKAMSSLTKGRGLVLVLVNLQ